MAHDVFISHSAKDKATADAVCARMEAEGIRCWVAPRDILPGLDWGEAIVNAIEGCRLMVLVFSANANDSTQIKREVERAVHHGKTIIPFRVEDVVPSKSLEYFISTSHWLDALSPPLDQHITRLCTTVKTLMGTAEASASPLFSAQPVPAPPEGQDGGPRRNPRRFRGGVFAVIAGMVLVMAIGYSLYRHNDGTKEFLNETPVQKRVKRPAQASEEVPWQVVVPASPDTADASWSRMLDQARQSRFHGNISDALATYSRYQDLFEEKYPSTRQYIKTVQAFTLQHQTLGVRGGAYIFEMVPGGAADAAGLTVGDVIIGYAGFLVHSTKSYVASWSKLVDGTMVTLDYLRMSDTGQFEKKHITLPHGILGVRIMDF